MDRFHPTQSQQTMLSLICRIRHIATTLVVMECCNSAFRAMIVKLRDYVRPAGPAPACRRLGVPNFPFTHFSPTVVYINPLCPLPTFHTKRLLSNSSPSPTLTLWVLMEKMVSFYGVSPSVSSTHASCHQVTRPDHIWKIYSLWLTNEQQVEIEPFVSPFLRVLSL